MSSQGLISELMPGALQYVRACGLKSGDQALLIAADNAEPVVVEAVCAAVGVENARVTICYMPTPTLYFQEPPPPLAEAMFSADVVLDVGALVWGHSEPSILARYDFGTKGGILHPPIPDTLLCPGARFPLNLLLAIVARVTAECAVDDWTPLHITSPGGTDLTGRVWQSHCTAGGRAGGPGLFTIYPGAAFGFIPPLDVNGRAVFEAYTGFGGTSEPLEFTIKDNFVTHIAGGHEADEIRRRIDGVVDGNFISEIMWGLNPKARVDLTITPISLEAERSPLTLHLGMGDEKMSGSPRRVFNKRSESRVLHQDGFMLYPTLTVGDRRILEAGALVCLEEPEMKAIASQFGDPDDLLSPMSVRR
jgi:hypothetical protein